ncbi:hypothetical protein [Piscinibacterium candidicorallinum]|uniref:Alginate export domain-containing protein n=1 Tax=Piscinibacterium candidicorallinum TaxID=1793872 RepID=A0ABV7H6G9_9BURK
MRSVAASRASCLAILISALAPTAVLAQSAPPPAWSTELSGLKLDAGIETYSAYYSMRGTWWNLSAASAPDFDKSRSFIELWLQPKLNGHYPLGNGAQLYGTAALGLSKTLGSDAFDYRNQGEARMSTAVLGVRGDGGGWRYDASFGRQPFTLGTGMLLTAGASNGYSWGGGASTQRKAWGNSVIASVGSGSVTGSIFELRPDEAPEAKTDTVVRGASVQWAPGKMGVAGLAYLTVPKSTAIYPGDLAPLAFIDSGRQGLDTWHGWADLTGVVPGVPELGLRAEFARQSNTITRANGRRDPMRAEAWLLGASWWAQTWPFAPKFSYHRARFSGDKPGTSTYERFDPMFWGNGLNNWWFGANGAYSWLNANIRAERFIVDAYFSAKDAVQLQYVKTEADQLNSAVQFGQGVRFTSDGLLVGVPSRPLSSELYLQYARVFSPKLIAIAFLARSSPSAGLKATAPQGTQNWTTIGLGLTANY